LEVALITIFVCKDCHGIASERDLEFKWTLTCIYVVMKGFRSCENYDFQPI